MQTDTNITTNTITVNDTEAELIKNYRRMDQSNQRVFAEVIKNVGDRDSRQRFTVVK